MKRAAMLLMGTACVIGTLAYAADLQIGTWKLNEVTLAGKIAVTADGKSRTVTTSGTNAKGQKVTTTAVYDKQ